MILRGQRTGRRRVYSIADGLAAIIAEHPATERILLSPRQHHELYETMPGVKRPYAAHNWADETLVFQGVDILVAPTVTH